MTSLPLVITDDGEMLTRDDVMQLAAALLAQLDLGPTRPALLPLCTRYGDLIITVAAARHASLPIVLPYDSGAAVVNKVIAETGDVVVLASSGDDMSGLDDACRIETVSRDPGRDALAPLGWGDEMASNISLFTSGTTGAPVRHTHPFDMFEAGARKWAAFLGIDAGTLVCTVPPQHMYGFEASIILPLCHPGFSVLDTRPFFTGNVAGALEAVPAPRILVTTPVHLDLLVREEIRLPDLHAIVSATAPLSNKLARSVERQFDAKVIEVFGTTETGMIGTRETAKSEVFLPRDDLRISFNGNRMSVSSAWQKDDLIIDDTIEMEADGFRYIGRGDDLVNVAGKRASLAGLTRSLQQIDGVRDGVFVMPEDDTSRPGLVRPVAFAVAPGMDADAIQTALRERIQHAFVPRRIVFLDEIPKTQSGKPQVSRLLEMLADSGATFSIPDDHPSLAGHFPGNPVVPGAVILDCALRAVSVRPAYELKSVKFFGVLRPMESCLVEKTEIRGRTEITCRIGKRKIMSAQLASGRS